MLLMNIKIKGGYVPTKIDNIHEHIQIVKQGVGSPKPHKGKGSYRRQPKHRTKRLDY